MGGGEQDLGAATPSHGGGTPGLAAVRNASGLLVSAGRPSPPAPGNRVENINTFLTGFPVLSGSAGFKYKHRPGTKT